MPRSNTPTAAARATIARLAEPPRVSELHPIAARLIHALRLIALHERAGQDPVPELATRMGHVGLAARALALAQAAKVAWPENIRLSRFCCGFLTHDEATMGDLIECALLRDRDRFDGTVEGFIRAPWANGLWDASTDLVAAELGEL